MPPTLSEILGLGLTAQEPDPTVSLDLPLSRGGFTCGRLLENSEVEWTGKSTLVFESIAELQKNGVYIYIDSEQALDESFFGFESLQHRVVCEGY